MAFAGERVTSTKDQPPNLLTAFSAYLNTKREFELISDKLDRDRGHVDMADIQKKDALGLADSRQIAIKSLDQAVKEGKVVAIDLRPLDVHNDPGVQLQTQKEIEEALGISLAELQNPQITNPHPSFPNQRPIFYEIWLLKTRLEEKGYQALLNTNNVNYFLKPDAPEVAAMRELAQEYGDFSPVFVEGLNDSQTLAQQEEKKFWENLSPFGEALKKYKEAEKVVDELLNEPSSESRDLKVNEMRNSRDKVLKETLLPIIKQLVADGKAIMLTPKLWENPEGVQAARAQVAEYLGITDVDDPKNDNLFTSANSFNFGIQGQLKMTGFQFIAGNQEGGLFQMYYMKPGIPEAEELRRIEKAYSKF